LNSSCIIKIASYVKTKKSGYMYTERYEKVWLMDDN
jgi:hypothetical protein